MTALNDAEFNQYERQRLIEDIDGILDFVAAGALAEWAGYHEDRDRIRRTVMNVLLDWRAYCEGERGEALPSV